MARACRVALDVFAKGEALGVVVVAADAVTDATCSGGLKHTHTHTAREGAQRRTHTGRVKGVQGGVLGKRRTDG